MYDGSELVAVASPVVVFDQRASVLVSFSESRLLYLHVTGQPRLTALLRRPSGNRDEADVGAECFQGYGRYLKTMAARSCLLLLQYSRRLDCSICCRVLLVEDCNRRTKDPGSGEAGHLRVTLDLHDRQPCLQAV